MVFRFTLFTSLYNRRHTVHRVWESVQSQTLKDFEWIIVDDGSTDEVVPLLEKYKKEADFPVIILMQENQGKHVAWNKALKVANGELFIPADSDDAFIPETLERFQHYWNGIPKAERLVYSGINCLCKDPVTGKVVGNPFPKSPLVSNNLELYYRYKVRGEKWGCIRTDVLREYLFPEIQGRGCFNLSYIWTSIARKYKSLSVNEPLRLYYTDSGNTITQKPGENLLKTAPVDFHFLKWDLNTNLDYKFRYWYFAGIVKSFLNLWRTGLLLGERKAEIIKEMKGIAKILTILSYIPGWLIYNLTYKKIARVKKYNN
jgi:glycosyltransferase involved in cell wall biosynthesis